MVLWGRATIDLTGRRGTIVIESARGVENRSTGGVDVSLVVSIGCGEIGGEKGSERGEIVKFSIDNLRTVGRLLRESRVTKSNEKENNCDYELLHR